MKKNNIWVRLGAIVTAIVLVVVMAVPAFASTSTNGVVWKVEMPLDSAAVTYADGTTSVVSLGNDFITGVDGVNTTNTPLQIGMTEIYPEGRAQPITNWQYAVVDGSWYLFNSYITINESVKSLRLRCNDVLTQYASDLWKIKIGAYTGTVTVTVKYYVYKEDTNYFVETTETVTHTLTGSMATGPNMVTLFEGMTLRSGKNSLVIIQSVDIFYQMSTAGNVQLKIDGLPISTNSSLYPFVNAIRGDVIIDGGSTNAPNLFGWLISPIEAFFAVELCPGVSLGGVGTVLLCALVVAAVLMFLKGK